MSYDSLWMAYGLWALIIGLGVAIAVIALRAGIRTPSRSLTLLGIGFLLISLVAGVLWIGIYAVLDAPVMADVGACAAMAAGFAAVLASVLVRAL